MVGSLLVNVVVAVPMFLMISTARQGKLQAASRLLVKFVPLRPGQPSESFLVP
ncbi:hypothetical protein [Streptomyces flaveolus]|uniref:hypothetical protein n=1 Tax=Streptomyces flaveolus TaxID=67297 RepID=UPI00382D32B6